MASTRRGFLGAVGAILTLGLVQRRDTGAAAPVTAPSPEGGTYRYAYTEFDGLDRDLWGDEAWDGDSWRRLGLDVESEDLADARPRIARGLQREQRLYAVRSARRRR